jgi:hypothetical protein
VSSLAELSVEAALTPAEVEQILRICGSRALLVGGQSLAAWASYYSVQPPAELSRSITVDADFVGTSQVARLLQQSLGEPWRVREGTLDDAGVQVAKVFTEPCPEGIKQIDFHSGILGESLSTEKIQARASTIEYEPGMHVKVLHPLDVLESRLCNLALLSSKRNKIGVAQARLAVQVVYAFLLDHLQDGRDPRVVRQATKRVERMALDAQLANVASEYGIDVLSAIPTDQITNPRFHAEQWPRIQERLANRRRKYYALQVRKRLAAESALKK